MNMTAEQFLTLGIVIAFVITGLLALISRYQFEIEDAIDSVWATLQKLLR